MVLSVRPGLFAAVLSIRLGPLYRSDGRKDCSGGRDKLRPIWPIPGRPARCPALELWGSAPGYPCTRQSRCKHSTH